MEAGGQSSGGSSKAGMGAAVVMLTLLLGGAVLMVVRGLVSSPPAAAGGAIGPASTVAGEMNGKDVETVLRAAETFINEGHPEQAVIALDRAIGAKPDDLDLRLAMARARLALKQWPEALEEYQQAIRIGPTTGSMLFDAATVANTAGKLQDSADLYTRAQFKDPKEPKFPLYLAMVQVKLGQDEAASVSLLRVVNMNPDIAEAWGTLAEIGLKNNQLSLAEQHVGEARKRQPDVLRWRLVHAKVLKRANRTQEALDLLIGLSESERFTPAVLTTMGECFGLMKQPDRAASMYADAFGANDKNAEFAFQAAFWFEKAGNVAKAREFANKAVLLGHSGAREFLAGLK